MASQGLLYSTSSSRQVQSETGQSYQVGAVSGVHDNNFTQAENVSNDKHNDDGINISDIKNEEFHDERLSEVDANFAFGHSTGGEGSESDFNVPVKLFVGQVPKSMEESDISPFFEKFGTIDDVSIIRDKHTNQHRGCAFVTFRNKVSADACEEELHNQFVFDNGKRPVQIRPAGKKGTEHASPENEVENKLFVGMLPRDVQEHVVRELFQPYGEITGVYIIRSNDGIKKGCAFVKYAERESALAAIEQLNDQVTVGASERPLIVKFADTRSQKRARQNQQIRRELSYHSTSGLSQSSHGSHVGSPYFITSGPPPPVHVFPGHGTPPPMGISAPHNHSSGGYSPQGQYHHSYPSTHGSNPTLPSQYLFQQVSPYGISPGAHYHEQSAHVNIPKQRYPRTDVPMQHRYGNQAGMVEVVNPRPREGPAGANLFIYHLPHDLTDADLATAFNPFGNVISAKVYVDRFTGESKGFGFVSYDSVVAAENAIEQMNGFQIGNKRLKVQHKRVNFKPPIPSHAYYLPPPLVLTPPAHDVPPSIDILSEADDIATAGHTSSSQSTPQHDLDALTRGFGILNTEDRSDFQE
eukprot:CAMPEP_0184865846 /NCGR_PEP_ID=MMETSP0580-20130426/19396_1 /TAXON_ID=1118495 /ORGANISM="Dactyliosolen fragilissimus" /LENGTH=581 /DNA_ID=CAMNT_0027365215 /DNA_START=281 /DNA_END=2026 /DNA_ORIENTATION=-